MRAFTIVPLLFGAHCLAQTLMSREYPHLIVPISKLHPNDAQGTKKSFDVERDVRSLHFFPPSSSKLLTHHTQIWTETSFDIPANGAIFCSLSLTINTDPARGAPFELWGAEPYVFNVSSVVPRGLALVNDTWNNRSAPIEWIASFKVWKSGAVEQVGGLWFSCAKGQAVQYLASPGDVERDGGVMWYELDDPVHGLTYNMYA
jgi:hypothetical protein